MISFRDPTNFLTPAYKPEMFTLLHINILIVYKEFAKDDLSIEKLESMVALLNIRYLLKNSLWRTETNPYDQRHTGINGKGIQISIK